MQVVMRYKNIKLAVQVYKLRSKKQIIHATNIKSNLYL